jgi:hypothetical protein
MMWRILFNQYGAVAGSEAGCEWVWPDPSPSTSFKVELYGDSAFFILELKTAAEIQSSGISEPHRVEPSLDPLEDPALILRKESQLLHPIVSKALRDPKNLQAVSGIIDLNGDELRHENL